MYYVWTISSDFPNLYWLEYDSANNPDYLDFFNSEILEFKKEVKFYLNRKASIDKFKSFDYIKSDAIPIVSNKLAEIIRQETSEDVQLIEVKVFQENNFVDTYFIPNVLNIIDCIDPQKSIKDEFDDYMKLTFKPKGLGNHKIVKAEGYRDWDFVVDESFVNACNKAKIKGIDFYKEPYIDPLY
jgi:Immunity protein family (Imm11)